MQRDINLVHIIIAILLSISAITFIANVCYTVQNKSLSQDVSNNFDEKSTLRAKFLTRISARNLARKADNFEMVQLSDNQIQTVKKNKDTVPHKSFFQKLAEALTQKNIVSGY